MGALCAATLCIWITKGVTPPNPRNEDNWLRAMVQEGVGTFAYVFFFMFQSENKDVVSDIETVQCFSLAASFIAGRSIVLGNARFGTYGAILNPAIGFATFFVGIFYDAKTAFKWCWLYPAVPFWGSIMAIIFYEFVYKKSVEGKATDAGENGKGIVAPKEDY